MEQIKTLAMNENIVRYIADYVFAEYLKKDKDLGKIAFVFGGKRPSAFLKRELAKKAGRGFISPKFFSMNEFIKYIVLQNDNISSMAGIDGSYSIYKYAKKFAPAVLRNRTDFVKFLPWANEIRAFIDQLDIECVDAQKLKSVQSSAEIGYDVPKEINILLSNIADIREKYHDELYAKKAYSEGLWYLEASKLVEKTDKLEFERIYFCNFLYLHKSELKILKYLKEKNIARFFFQGGKNDWSILEDTGKYLSLDISAPSNAKPDYSLNLYSGFDTHSQASIVKDIAENIKNKDNAILVVPDEEAIIPVLAEISPTVQSFNVSLGYPLRKTPLFSLLEDILKAQETKKAEGYYVKDYLEVLKHPFVKNLKILNNSDTTRVVIHKIEEALSGSMPDSPFAGNLFIDLGELEGEQVLISSVTDTLARMASACTKEEAQKVIAALHGLLFKQWDEIRSFKGLMSSLENLINTLIELGYAAAYSLNVKAVEKMLEIIEDFKKSEFIAENFVKEDIFKLFKEYILDEKINFAGSPLKGFQILGQLESRSLNFDDVIIMDMNESVMPSLRIQEPLIPRDIMLGLGLSRVEKEEEIQRYHFRRLIAGAKNVHLVYSENDKNEKSRFIEELIWEHQKNTGSMETFPVKRAKYNITIGSEKSAQPKTKEVAEYLKKFSYSPTKVDSYLSCPKRFYFEHVLGLKEKENVAEDVESVDIGIFLHDFLEHILKEFAGKEYKITAEFKAKFTNKLQQAFDAKFAARMKSDIFLLKDMVNFAMKKFLDTEEKRAADIQKITGLERWLPGEIKFGENSYSFNARLDRIDLMRDNSLCIIDYKSGTIHKSQGLKSLSGLAFNMDRKLIKQKIQSFQLPLYIHFIQKEERSAVNACLYSLKKTEIEYFYKKEENEIERKAKMDICMKALEFILSEITDPGVPFAADSENPEQCDRCPFYYACR